MPTQQVLTCLDLNTGKLTKTTIGAADKDLIEALRPLIPNHGGPLPAYDPWHATIEWPMRSAAKQTQQPGGAFFKIKVPKDDTEPQLVAPLIGIVCWEQEWVPIMINLMSKSIECCGPLLPDSGISNISDELPPLPWLMTVLLPNWACEPYGAVLPVPELVRGLAWAILTTPVPLPIQAFASIKNVADRIEHLLDENGLRGQELPKMMALGQVAIAFVRSAINFESGVEKKSAKEMADEFVELIERALLDSYDDTPAAYPRLPGHPERCEWFVAGKVLFKMLQETYGGDTRSILTVLGWAAGRVAYRGDNWPEVIDDLRGRINTSLAQLWHIGSVT